MLWNVNTAKPVPKIQWIRPNYNPTFDGESNERSFPWTRKPMTSTNQHPPGLVQIIKVTLHFSFLLSMIIFQICWFPKMEHCVTNLQFKSTWSTLHRYKTYSEFSIFLQRSWSLRSGIQQISFNIVLLKFIVLFRKKRYNFQCRLRPWRTTRQTSRGDAW